MRFRILTVIAGIALWGCGTAQRAQKTTAPWEVLSAEGYAQVGGAPGGGGGNVVYTLQLTNKTSGPLYVLRVADEVATLTLEPETLVAAPGATVTLRGYRKAGGTRDLEGETTGGNLSPSLRVRLYFTQGPTPNLPETEFVVAVHVAPSKPIE